ncbi:MAG: AzlD domain-containing protein [Ramlibacter sp.]
MTDVRTVAIILGLAAVTVVARSFFFLTSRPGPLPRWVERGLQYAPIAALSAVVVPEILTAQGQWSGLVDARVFGAAAGAAAFFWRRSVLATIGVGMAVYLPLHVALGW